MLKEPLIGLALRQTMLTLFNEWLMKDYAKV